MFISNMSWIISLSRIILHIGQDRKFGDFAYWRFEQLRLQIRFAKTYCSNSTAKRNVYYFFVHVFHRE